MSVWLTIPSKRPHEEADKVLKLWRARGYKIALWRDTDDELLAWADAGTNGATFGEYPGYAFAVNHLMTVARTLDDNAEWFIAAGDDVEPDLNHSAEEIAEQCGRNFGANEYLGGPLKPSTFGVMQPTGDRWGDRNDGKGAYIDRVLGSAWYGREYCQRMYGGRGPLWPEYFHMFEDEEAFHVAQKYGVLWQRRDLIQLHRHWGRGTDANPNALQNRDTMPKFLERANSREEWDRAKKIFETRKAQGFPGSEPL